MTTLIAELSAELRGLLEKAIEPAPKFQRKPGGLAGGLTRDEHHALDDWKYRVGTAKADIARILPSLLSAIETAEARVEKMRGALEEIADEQKVYKGHGDYDILPALTADEAMMRARQALADPGDDNGPR